MSMGAWASSGARDLALLLGLGVSAEALANGSVAHAARDAAGDLAVYVALSGLGSIWRSAWNARDGKMPGRGVLARSLVISLGVGLTGGLLLIDLGWSPFVKMATLLLLSFGADWAIPAAQGALRSWASRIVPPAPPAAPPRRRTDPPSSPDGGGIQ